MKKMYLAVLLSSLFITAMAQRKNDRAPKWVSNTGYWVVESNIKTPKKSIVFFYNNNNTLVYKENVEGVVININKRRIKMSLKKVLEQAVYVYDQKKFHSENEMWVMNAVK